MERRLKRTEVGMQTEKHNLLSTAHQPGLSHQTGLLGNQPDAVSHVRRLTTLMQALEIRPA